MNKFAVPPLEVRVVSDERYELWSSKPYELLGKKSDELLFTSLTIRKDHIEWCFVPIYTDPGLKDVLSPRLMEQLEGTLCFHLTQIDDQTLRDIKDAMEKGIRLYQGIGWI